MMLFVMTELKSLATFNLNGECRTNPRLQYLSAFFCIKRNMKILELIAYSSGYSLGIWVNTQRHKLPKMKDCVVCNERIKKLNNIQFEWEPRSILPKMRDSNVLYETIKMFNNIQFGFGTPKNNWDAMFERLLLYKKEHGDT